MHSIEEGEALPKVAVIGQGYVGLPLAMLAVEVGYSVVGIDVDPARVDQLCRGVSYVDDITDSRLQAALESGKYKASSDYSRVAGFEVAVITVPTPLCDRAPDLSHIVSSAQSLSKYIEPGCVVVLESTTYPGTTEDQVRPILEEGCGLVAGRDFSLGYSPERVDPGNDTWTLSATPKIVSGINDTSLHAIREFYGKFVADVVPMSSPRAAELTKLLENTFRHVNIALVNEFAIFSKELGVDVWEVIRAASTKPFGFLPFYPGPGVGGHCLPIDPTYLSWHVQRATGRQFRFVELANDINEHMPDHVVRRIVEGLNQFGRSARGSTVLLIGLAYKRNSSDARESPAARVVQLLLSMGANVEAVDSHVPVNYMAGRVRRRRLTVEAVRNAQAVVVLTDHDDLDYQLIEREAAWVLDCRNRLSGVNVESL